MNLLEYNSCLAERARVSGSDFYSANDFSKAFANFLLALTIKREWVDDLEVAFIHSLCEWGRWLEEEGRYSELFACYEQAIHIYPFNEVIQNNLGAHLLRLDHFKEASCYFREALRLNPSYLPAHRNLENVSNFLVERWHFRMLNDRNRNESFRRAIHTKIEQGFTRILDVGTGTGLLSLFAAEKNPKFVFACDYSQVMTSIASDIIHNNGLSDKVKIINKLSNNLHIPDDIPERVELLVTETVDAGLVGEGLLQTLDDAWTRLLVSGGRVVPERATMYLAPVESSYLRTRYKHQPEPSPHHRLHLVALVQEPYDTVDFKSNPYQFLAEPMEIFHFDFNSAEEIRGYLEGEKSVETSVVCDEGGFLDGLCVWFDMHLNDSETVSTSPLYEGHSSWEQAVFPIDSIVTLRPGSRLQVKMDVTGGRLSLTSYSVDNSITKQSAVFKVSKDLIKFLNSETTMNGLNLLLDEIMKRNLSISNVLDTCIYPHIGLKLLENGSKLVSFKDNEADLQYLKFYCRSNNIGVDMYEFFSLENLTKYLKEEPKFDVAVIDVLDSHGELNDVWLTLYPLVRKAVKENGILFPQEISVHCELAYSEWLENSSKLTNVSLIQEFKGFTSINDFKVNHFIDLDMNKLKYVKMSPVVEVARVKIGGIFSDVLEEFSTSTRATADGPINSVLYWFCYYGDDGGVVVSTAAPDFYRNQTAEMLDPPISVTSGSQLTLKLQLMSCILKFSIHVSS